MADKVEPYGMLPEFERTVARMCAVNPKFYGRVGHALDPAALALPECALVLKAVRAIVKDLGQGPTAEMIVLQRLRSMRQDGKVTTDQIDAVIDLFLDGPPLPDITQVMGEVVPILKRRKEASAVRTAMDIYAQRGDMDEVVRILESAKKLGTADVSMGLRLGVASFDAMESVRFMDKLGTGVPELDSALNGGLPLGSLIVYVAASGGGKSMMLNHQAAHAIRQGYFTVYATLELSEEICSARITSNLTGIPISALLEGDHGEAREILQEMHPVLGTLLIKHFSPKVATVNDIKHWIAECEEVEGHKVHFDVVDYADKLGSTNRDDKGEYAAQGTVYESLRIFNDETRKWGATASQATRKAGKEKGRRIDLDDIADSLNKGRVADIVVTLSKDGEQLIYNIAKNRHWTSDVVVGPLPHAWECGMMIPRSVR